jgi:trehalose-phosphatase
MLEELAGREPLLLCLDYDGTIAEIVSRPASARPVEGLVAALTALAKHPDRVALAIVSGRPVADLRRIAGLPDGLMFAGIHGLEIAGRDGVTRSVEDAGRCAAEIDTVRQWLARSVGSRAGFQIEDKRLSVALHYRNADAQAAALMKKRFEEFVRESAPHLRIAHNKMVIEALPVAASKGRALRALMQEVGAAFLPVYFGDDCTDEDAFAELVERGVSVMVGEPRPTLAHWRVGSPADVARVLIALASSIGQ